MNTLCSLHRFQPALLIALAAFIMTLARAEGQITARYSHSANNRLQRSGASGGAVGVEAAFFEWRQSAALDETTRLNYGLTWNLYDFSRSGPMVLPEKLQAVSLALGATRQLNQQWLLIGSIQPGLYGDLDNGARGAFKAPVLLLSTYLQNHALAWSFGLIADSFADKRVIPIVGVKWRFAPRWEFTVGFPRAGFVYALNPALKFGLGATIQGGSFHVTRDLRPVSLAVGPRLDDTYLDYREIRVGLSAEYVFNDTLSFSVEAGAITDQKFDYYEHGYTLHGDTAGFFTLGLSGRF